jgi:antitoxin component YwqK of YwqJK toxin-antitoxin module
MLSLAFLFFSCKQSLEEYWSNGNLKTKVEYLESNKENYRYSEYFEDGQLKIESTYQRGLLDGDFRQYYRNGQLMYLRHYNQGVIIGVEQFYSETGEIQQQRIYKNSRIVDEQNYRKTSQGTIQE